jgi:hypothetical protein
VQWDGYGTPITMNYKGDDTFKTVPGTLLTILSNVFLLYTLFLKGRQLYLKTDPDFIPYKITEDLVKLGP